MNSSSDEQGATALGAAWQSACEGWSSLRGLMVPATVCVPNLPAAVAVEPSHQRVKALSGKLRLLQTHNVSCKACYGVSTHHVCIAQGGRCLSCWRRENRLFIVVSREHSAVSTALQKVSIKYTLVFSGNDV